jgi:hypothetical protein
MVQEEQGTVHSRCISECLVMAQAANQRIKFAPFGRPIRKSEALLLSAYTQRYVAT